MAYCVVLFGANGLQKSDREMKWKLHAKYLQNKKSLRFISAKREHNMKLTLFTSIRLFAHPRGGGLFDFSKTFLASKTDEMVVFTVGSRREKTHM